jgi:hypothetical protein
MADKEMPILYPILPFFVYKPVVQSSFSHVRLTACEMGRLLGTWDYLTLDGSPHYFLVAVIGVHVICAEVKVTCSKFETFPHASTYILSTECSYDLPSVL